MSLNFMNKAQIESYKKLPRSLKYFIGICLFYLVYAFFSPAQAACTVSGLQIVLLITLQQILIVMQP